MFRIEADEPGRLRLIGRLDAARADEALVELYRLDATTELDCSELKYISSAGFGVLFAAHSRLMDLGAGLILVHLSPHLRELFQLAGFDQVLEIAPPEEAESGDDKEVTNFPPRRR